MPNFHRVESKSSTHLQTAPLLFHHLQGIHNIRDSIQVPKSLTRSLGARIVHLHIIRVSIGQLIIHRTFQTVLSLNLCPMLTQELLSIYNVIHVCASGSSHNVVRIVKIHTRITSTISPRLETLTGSSDQLVILKHLKRRFPASDLCFRLYKSIPGGP